jgi:two-component system, NtrC family, response regulator AtoC
MLIRLVLAAKDKDLQKHLKEKFTLVDVRVDCFSQDKNIWQKVVRSCGDIIIISESLIPSPTETGIAILNDLPENPTTVVLHDSDSSEEFAQLTAAGADVILYSGISKKSLVEAIETTVESRRQFVQKMQAMRRSATNPKLADFTSQSQSMQMFMNEVLQVIPSDSPILILGETGVGKEHLAKVIHSESPRSAGPFIAVNAAAVPEQLLESELFGHERGAFTGATRYRRGTFELAHEGTIFLDEIGELPLNLQAKLLRVLQDYEVKPLGGEKPVWMDVRVIAATNKDLEKETQQGNFRRDLYYRLSVLMLTIPPLRLRMEDISAMTRKFIAEFRHKIGRDVNRISDPALKALQRYDWPGNVRELMNVIERAILLCKTDEIDINDLPLNLSNDISPRERMRRDATFDISSWKDKTLPEVLKDEMDQVERLYIQMVLKKSQGRVGQAAQIADIHPRGLYNKMKKYDLRKEDFKN